VKAYAHDVTSDVRAAAATGYGRAADAYARARPSYPAAAVNWLLEAMNEPSRVVEIGAGTGKFTAQLVERGIAVLAVEPVAAMREHLAFLGPLVTPVDATAENLPLQDGSVDCVVASQSLHWADVPVALGEFDRVLHPTGAVALIWNFRDLAFAWQRDLEGLLGELRGDAPHSRDGRWQRALEDSAFATSASETWRWSLDTDEAGVLDRVRSVSYVAAMPEQRQRQVEQRVSELLRRHGLHSVVEFPYVTEAYVLRRSSQQTM
jgi:SAM-dependent methyltransferase